MSFNSVTLIIAGIIFVVLYFTWLYSSFALIENGPLKSSL